MSPIECQLGVLLAESVMAFATATNHRFFQFRSSNTQLGTRTADVSSKPSDSPGFSELV
jgi:hypothetical protein